MAKCKRKIKMPQYLQFVHKCADSNRRRKENKKLFYLFGYAVLLGKWEGVFTLTQLNSYGGKTEYTADVIAKSTESRMARGLCVTVSEYTCSTRTKLISE